MAAVSDEARIRELAEVIRSKCAQAQQIRQQPPVVSAVSLASSAINLQPTLPLRRRSRKGQLRKTTKTPQQEVRKRLKEVVVRLHEDVRDNSLSGIQQRLQYTAGKFGLSFSVQRAPGHPPTCYMSCESFFLEVCLEETGAPISTKLVLGQEQQNSEVLTDLLRLRDYQSFEGHIRALVDIFNQYIGQEKSKVLLQVIKTTEQILLKIYKTSNSYNNPVDAIQLGTFGLLVPRQAGNPMSLTFYTTPQESLNSLELENYKIGTPLPESLGISAKVLVERSIQPYKLPIDPNIFDIAQSSFLPLTDQNTISVPLTLVMCLTKDIPICANIMLKLQQTVYGADQTMPSLTTPHVNALILQENKYLPGQVHTYFGLNSFTDMESDHRGVILPNRKVPFTHPSHVISIIHLLRQQLVYNTLVKSCLQRKKLDQSITVPSIESSFDDYEFKIVTKPPQMIAVTTELLSNTRDVTTVKFEFLIPNADRGNHPTHPKLQIIINDDNKLEQSQLLNQILARCLSIPVTIHSILTFTSILPPSLVAVISNHKESIKQFHMQLASWNLEPSSMENMTVNKGVLAATTNIAGMKRKRT